MHETLKLFCTVALLKSLYLMIEGNKVEDKELVVHEVGLLVLWAL